MIPRRLSVPLFSLLVAILLFAPVFNSIEIPGKEVRIETKATNDILLVDATPYEYYDDDPYAEKNGEGNSGESNPEIDYYKDTLDTNGYTYDTWIVYESWDEEFPPLTDMKTYEIIIWFYGDSYMYSQQQNPFLYEIPRYLDAGGKMLISGTPIVPYVVETAPDFMDDHLKAVYSGDSSVKTISGVDGDYIGDELSFEVEGGDGADNNWEDCPIINPNATDAQTIFKAGGASVGLRVKTSTFKLVFFSFNYEAISDSDSRTLLMQRLMDYLKGRPTVVHTPLGDTEDLDSGYEVKAEIRGEGLNTSTAKVIYRANQTDHELVLTRVGATDEFTATIPAQPVNTTVNYYIKASNIELMTTTSPLGVNESDPSTYHTFFVGPDKKPPVITPTIMADTVRTDQYDFSAKVSDNLGVDTSSVKLYYRQKGADDYTSVSMVLAGKEFKVSVPGAPTETVIEYYFEAQDLATEPNMATYPEEGNLQFSIVYHRLLLLDNSNSQTRITDYKDALSGVGYWNWSVSNKGYPTDYDLRDYSDIIWVLGVYEISSTAQDLMSTFMDNGGKVFLVGTNLFRYDYYYYEEEANNSFLNDYFYVDRGDWYYGQTIVGVSGDPIGDGISITSTSMWGGFSGDGFSILDEDRAFPCLLAQQDYWYDTTGVSPTVGVRVEGEGYTAVVFSFELGSTSGTDTEDVLTKVLEWLDSPYIYHEPLMDTEDTQGPFDFQATVIDGDLKKDDVKLHYKIGSDGFAENVMSAGTEDVFTTSVDGPGSKADIYYYISATDKSGHVSLSPRGADEAELTTLHKFHVGPDEVPPIITHKPLGDNIELPHYYVNVTITDNMGVDASSVTLYYKTNDDDVFTSLTFTDLGDGAFTANIPSQTEGTTVYYYITAKDLASSPNLASAPADGAYSFTVFDKIPVLILDASMDIFGDLTGTESGKDVYQRLLEDMGVTYHYIRLEENWDDYMDDDVVWEEEDTGKTRQARPPPDDDDGGKDGDNETRESVTVEDLIKYNMVIYLPTIFGNDWDPIMEYLDDGGKLLIADSYFVAESYLDDSEFLSDYVGVTMDDASQDTMVVGIDDDPISDGMEIELESLGQTMLKVEKTYTEECFKFSSGVAGVHVDRDDYRLVVLSFNFEYIKNETDQDMLFEKIYSWLNGIPQILHEPHPDTEDQNGPYDITAKILDDDLLTDQTELIYKVGSGDFTTVQMTAAAENNYTAQIPGQAAGTRIYYYIKVADQSYNTVTSPFRGTEADLDSLHTFYVGEDKTKPEIIGERMPNSVPKEFYLFQATITDNLGLDMGKTLLHYKPSGRSTYENVAFIPTEIEDMFVAGIPGADLNVGDAIDYYAEARDLATTPNTGRFPETGSLSFKIVDRNVLLVDDDQGNKFEEVYKEILLENGFAFDHHDMSVDSNITGQKLMGYSAVIWFCSDAQMGTVSREEGEAISYYLDRGGNVLLTGNHIAMEADWIGWELDIDDWGDDDVWVDDDIEPRPLGTRQDKTDPDGKTTNGSKDDGMTDEEKKRAAEEKKEEEDKPPPEPEPEPWDDDTWDDDIIDEDSFVDFLGDYFGVYFGESGFSDTMRGTPGHPIGDGLQFEIASPGGIIGGFMGTTDNLKLDTGAERVFSIDSRSRMNSTGASYVGKHRSLFYSFNVHDILNESDAETVLVRSVNWLYEGAGNIQDSEPYLTVYDEGRREVGDLEYNFTVEYWDDENDLPQGVYCVINGVKYEMRSVDITDQDYTDGKMYYIQLKFKSGEEYKYHFESPGANKTKSYTFSTGFIGGTAMMLALIAGLLIIIVIIAIVVFIFMKNRGSKKELEAEEEVPKKAKGGPKAKKTKKSEKSIAAVGGGAGERPRKRSKKLRGKGKKELPEGETKALGTGSKCPSCNKPVSLDAAICPHCKTDLAEGLECPKCHGLIGENDTRCPHCGVRFGKA